MIAVRLSSEEIMERLCRLCRLGTSVMCRTTFPSGPSKWYVSMQGVGVPAHTMDMSGSTPEEAIKNTWQLIADPDKPLTLVRYFCKPDESVPGDGPQVWVRWNHVQDDWEDVVPPKDHWYASVASEIRTYAAHKCNEKSL